MNWGIILQVATLLVLITLGWASFETKSHAETTFITKEMYFKDDARDQKDMKELKDMVQKLLDMHMKKGVE